MALGREGSHVRCRLLLWLLLRLLLRWLLLRLLMLWQRRLRGGMAPTRGGLCVSCCKLGGQHVVLLSTRLLKPLEFGELNVTPTHNVLKLVNTGLG
jgi:hypothetical protein